MRLRRLNDGGLGGDETDGIAQSAKAGDASGERESHCLIDVRLIVEVKRRWWASLECGIGMTTDETR